MRHAAAAAAASQSGDATADVSSAAPSSPRACRLPAYAPRPNTAAATSLRPKTIGDHDADDEIARADRARAACKIAARGLELHASNAKILRQRTRMAQRDGHRRRAGEPAGLRRRSLQAPLGIATAAARPLEPPARRLHASAPAMRISVRGHNFALVGERTMGKVSWPAGHALADWILERGDAAGDAPPAATLVEVGAGCGLPALAAAALGRAAGWSCVAATDFVEHAVELLRENVVRNAAQIHVARLDAVEGGVAALSAVIDEAETAAAAAPPPRELWIVAADIHYHEAVVAALLAAAAGVARARPSRRVRVVLARSSNFEHCDAAVERAAAECGLRLVRRHVRRAAGVLDAIGLDGGAAYVGCDDDVSDLFEYEVEEAAEAEAAALAEAEEVEEEVVEAQFEPFMPSLPGGAIELATCDLAPLLSLEEIGSRVWPAAVRLVQELQTPVWRQRLRASRACVELGSRTGAVGLAASVLGAATVVLTDLPELLETCERNAARNAARAAGTVVRAARVGRGGRGRARRRPRVNVRLRQLDLRRRNRPPPRDDARAHPARGAVAARRRRPLGADLPRRGDGGARVPPQLRRPPASRCARRRRAARRPISRRRAARARRRPTPTTWRSRRRRAASSRCASRDRSRLSGCAVYASRVNCRRIRGSLSPKPRPRG